MAYTKCINKKLDIVIFLVVVIFPFINILSSLWPADSNNPTPKNVKISIDFVGKLSLKERS
jgi:hypothetical protein